MKCHKLASVLLAAALGLTLAACGGEAAASDNGNAAPMQSGTAKPAETGPQTAEPSAAPADAGSEDEQTGEAPDAAETPAGGKILVAYFSATNNTEGIAQKLAEGLGADLYEITPEQPYTDEDLDYGNPRAGPLLSRTPLTPARPSPERWRTWSSTTLCSSAIPSGGAPRRAS